MGCHSLLQGSFLTQGSHPGFLHYRQILYWLSHQGITWNYREFHGTIFNYLYCFKSSTLLTIRVHPQRSLTEDCFLKTRGMKHFPPQTDPDHTDTNKVDLLHCWLLLLLLLSHFSRVRLCETRRQQPTRLLRPWDSPGKSTGVGCHWLSLVQGKNIF